MPVRPRPAIARILAPFSAVLAAVLLAACQLIQSAPPPPNLSTPPAAVRYTPGPDGLTAGLKSLSSYRVVYSQTVKGTLDGQPYTTHQAITRTLFSQPAAEDSVVDTLLADGTATYLHFVRLSGAAYFQRSADGACQGSAAGQPNGSIGDPAALLPEVSGALRVGPDVIDGVPATHYRIDGKAITLASGSASGDLWIASQGGYVVSYHLQILPPAPATGHGLEAATAIQYDVTDANQVVNLELPAACTPVLTGIPAMPDATDMDRRSGFMSYTTSSSAAGLTAFYNRELSALGWTPGGPAGQASLTYTKDQSTLQILSEPSTGGLTVYVQLFDPAGMPTLPAAVSVDTPTPGVLPPAPQKAATHLAPTAAATRGATRTVVPTEAVPTAIPPTATPPADWTVFNLPAEVPAYPNATQVQSLNGLGVSFQTQDGAAKVVAFYYARLENTHWKLISNQAGGTVSVLTWQSGENSLIMTIQTQSVQTQVSIILSGK